jgi:hypothetical protein
VAIAFILAIVAAEPVVAAVSILAVVPIVVAVPIVYSRVGAVLVFGVGGAVVVVVAVIVVIELPRSWRGIFGRVASQPDVSKAKLIDSSKAYSCDATARRAPSGLEYPSSAGDSRPPLDCQSTWRTGCDCDSGCGFDDHSRDRDSCRRRATAIAVCLGTWC